MSELTILLDGRIGSYCLEPLLGEFVKRGQSVCIVTYPDVKEQLLLRFPELSESFVDLRCLERRLPLQRKLHALLRLLITPSDFSNKYATVLEKQVKSPRLGLRLMARIAFGFPKVKSASVNRLLHNILKLITPNVLPCSRVLVVTMFGAPHLLCARGLEVFTLVESWDHAFKWPMGFCSKAVFCWNKSLSEDWKAFQGDSRREVFYPLKLRYLLEKPRSVQAKKSSLLLYPMSTSSVSLLGNAFEEELKIATVVCKAAEAAKWRVILKPKPNGRPG
ncbi:hypothetical protein N9A99_02570, partial [Akkermansiaceae bacterium]|nr:hypothetical protein [Akkermansiaceae bacterium]